MSRLDELDLSLSLNRSEETERLAAGHLRLLALRLALGGKLDGHSDRIGPPVCVLLESVKGETGSSARQTAPNSATQPSSGDATTFPVKQGGLAAQQADAVAESIAARLGAPVTPQPFRPVLRGLLLTGAAPRYLRAEIGGGRGERWPVAENALWWQPSKIAGRYLSLYLGVHHEEVELPAADPGDVTVDVGLGDGLSSPPAPTVQP